MSKDKDLQQLIVNAIMILLVGLFLLLTSCASIPFVKPLPPCDPSNFDMTSFKGRMAHYWCEVKQGAKKI
jgi:hypothetical protein